MPTAPHQLATTPRVSVVIPTHDRQVLVMRAVQSALAQTLADLEVIVVVDGPDEATAAALRQLSDPRLRVEVLPVNQGASAARNRGAALARAPWVALLDDDDQWLPQKLALQLATAEASPSASPIVATRFIARYAGREFVWPRRRPAPGEPLCQYILSQSSPFYGEGVLLTSALLVRRELIELVPFDLELRRLQDMDWLVRVGARGETGVEFVAEDAPLVVWDQLRFSALKTVRRSPFGWREFLGWLEVRRPLLTRRAYSSALLTWFAPNAVHCGERESFWPVLRAAFDHGAPTALDVALYLMEWGVPLRWRATLSQWYERLRPAVSR